MKNSRHPPDSKDANKASTSSSSVQKVSDAINSIYKNAMSAASGDGEIMDTDLQALVKGISYLLQHKRFQKVKVSGSLLKVKDSFSAGMKNVLKDIFPANASEARKMAIHLLNRIGKINGAMTAGLLIVIYILEGSETLSDNKSECLSLLNEMKTLAQYVINLKRRHRSKEEMVTDIIKQSIQLILRGSILCCTHMKSCRLSQIFKAGVRKAELDNLRKEVTSLYPKLNAAATIEGLVDEFNRNKHPQIPPEQIKYPDYAVGIDERLNEILRSLDWKSQGRIVTVFLYGVGGMGKTTLATAVLSKFNSSKKNCKFSRVGFEMDTQPCSESIKSLQTGIIKDLMGAHEPQIRTLRNGRQQIGRILKKTPAFIYIDNVLSRDSLDELLLLGSGLDKAKELRLLITARDKSIGNGLGSKMSPIYYEVKPIKPKVANQLVSDIMGTQNIDSKVKKEIITKCGGFPLLLNLIARFIEQEPDKENAYKIFREESKSWSGQIFCEKGLDELIGYNNLPEDLKDPFLDICSFFVGLDWDEVVDVLGSSVLQRLEKRALVTRNANVLTVHDVIRELGILKSKGTRIRGANKISELLNAKGSKEMDGIKVLWFTEEESVPISPKKLDPVSSSLRVLILKDSTTTIVGDCNKIFPKLIYLDAGMSPLPFHVSTFEKLRYLRYFPQKPADLNFSKMPSNLIRLVLNGTSYSRSLKHYSVELHGLQNLRCLKFFKFKHLTKLPEELGSLKRLEILHIINCDDFVELPESLGDLNALESLTVARCPKLKKLPESISRLTSLTYLSLRGCASLRRLPEHFGSLSSLKDLKLVKTGLKVLPSSFEKLSKLEVLYLASCSSLVDLPAGLGKLTSLVKLDLSSCGSLKKLPKSFKELKCLIKLNLSCCNELQELCKNFRDLLSLEHLTLSSCPMLAGKWMQKILRMKKTIKVVDITKSPMLLKEWKTLKDTNPPSNISVKTGRF